MSLDVYLGIDVGSVTTKLALVDEKGKYVDSYMLKTAGRPVDAVTKHCVNIMFKVSEQQVQAETWQELWLAQMSLKTRLRLTQ